jgi:hypothetical protein
MEEMQKEAKENDARKDNPSSDGVGNESDAYVSSDDEGHGAVTASKKSKSLTAVEKASGLFNI